MKEKLCDTCRYRNNVEQLKPCVVYRSDCEYYEEKREDMTREEALRLLQAMSLMLLGADNQPVSDLYEALNIAIEVLENIVALGEDMRICRESITDEKVLIGFNMAVAICNKYLGQSEGKE